MCNLLIAVRGKFAEAVDLGEKETWRGGGGGGCSKTLRNGNSRGWGGGSKVKNHPWDGGRGGGGAYGYFLDPHNASNFQVTLHSRMTFTNP